jgi:hypothetical protein
MMQKEKEDNPVIKRAVWEEKHHKTFDYKKKNKMCIECGEVDGLHTYTCVYYDTDK